MQPYLESLDVVFTFEALHSAGDPAKLREAIAGGLALGHNGSVLSNHDFPGSRSRPIPATRETCA